MNKTLLSQYVQGRKKPSEKQKQKILSGIHEIGQELSEINLINWKIFKIAWAYRALACLFAVRDSLANSKKHDKKQ